MNLQGLIKSGAMPLKPLPACMSFHVPRSLCPYAFGPVELRLNDYGL